jgi:hypothetical protein
MRTYRSVMTALAVSALGVGLLSLPAAAAPQPDPAPQPGTTAADYDPQMLRVLADSFGTTTQEAAQRLDREGSQQRALAALGRLGVPSDAYYSGDDLVVRVSTAEQARLVADAGPPEG